MWKLKIAQGNSPYLYSTNNFVGRQIWEFDPNGGNPEERKAYEKACEEFQTNKVKGIHGCSDLLMKIQGDLVSIPPVRLDENEEVSYEAVTVAVKKALRLNLALQTSDGHWPAEHSGPMFYTNPLIIALYTSGKINTDHLTSEHKKEMIRYIYNHQTFGSQLWDCSFTTQAIIATDMIKENPAGDFKQMYRHITKGGWTFSDQDHGWVVSDCTAEALQCLLLLSDMPTEIVGEKAKVERLYEAVNVILYLQSPETGGFAAWESPIPQQYLQALNSSEVFADIVVEQEQVECTAFAVSALVSFKRFYPGHRKVEIQDSLEKAVRFLEDKQWPNGSWYGYWGICFIYGTFFALQGLAAVGKTYENSEAVSRGVNFLLSTQNEEGGWGESHVSGRTMKYTPLDGNRTNLVQTSWAMLGLLYGGQATRDPGLLHKAAKLLINTQMSEGDFPQQEITGASMRSCLLHYAQYRNIFPLWALAEYRILVWPLIN